MDGVFWNSIRVRGIRVGSWVTFLGLVQGSRPVADSLMFPIKVGLDECKSYLLVTSVHINGIRKTYFRKLQYGRGAYDLYQRVEWIKLTLIQDEWVGGFLLQKFIEVGCSVFEAWYEPSVDVPKF